MRAASRASSPHARLGPAAALAFTLACAATLPVLGQGHGAAEPELAAREDRTLLAALQDELVAGDERALSDFEALFGRVSRRGSASESRNGPGDTVLEVAGEGERPRWEPLRRAAWRLVRKLPKDQRRKLADTQTAALATERSRGEDEDRLLERYPLADGAAAWAEELAARAATSADDLGAASFDRLAQRIASLAQGQPAPRSPAARLRRALALLAVRDLEGAQDELRRTSRALDPKADAGLLRTLGLVQKRVEAAVRARARLERRAPPEGTVAGLLAAYRFTRKDAVPTGTQASPVAARHGRTVFASDGSRLLVVDARTAELEGKLPQDDDEVGPPGTQVVGTVARAGDLVLAPLFFEDFLLPARKAAADAAMQARAEDPKVRGGFYSLFVFDAPGRRQLWCDGESPGNPLDEDPLQGGGRPLGMEGLDETAWRRWACAHVVGRPVADARRIYVPQATAAAEPQLWVAAFERGTSHDQHLALVPAWRTFLGSSLQGGTANATPPVGAANPRLALDPDGRVLVQTDLGFVAALDARTGALEWIVSTREEDAPGRRGPRARANEPHGFQPTNDPPVVVARRGSRPSVLVLAPLEQTAFLGLDVEDGSVLWKVDYGDVGFSYTGAESARVAALAPDVVALYGGQRVVLVDGATGKLLARATATLEPGEWPVGPLAPAGPQACVLPTLGGRAHVLRYAIRRGAPFDRALDDREQVPLEATLSLGEPFPLHEAEGPVGLVCLEERLVAVTGQAVSVYSWRKPD